MSSPNSVQFPRFQHYDDVEERVWQRAEPRNWLSADAVQLLLDPYIVSGEESVNYKKRTGWNGIQHHTQISTTRGLLIQPPAAFAQTRHLLDDTELFRSQVSIHDFLWDEQAVRGFRWEVVLERGSTAEPKFDEVMAIMGGGYYPKNSKGQLLVIKDELGEWREPSFTEPLGFDPTCKRDFYLEVAGRLALNGAPADEALGLSS